MNIYGGQHLDFYNTLNRSMMNIPEQRKHIWERKKTQS